MKDAAQPLYHSDRGSMPTSIPTAVMYDEGVVGLPVDARRDKNGRMMAVLMAHPFVDIRLD